LREEMGEELRGETREEIAKNALKEGATAEFVRKITGLAAETIQKLQAEMTAQ
jgi:hypothetical protein